MNKKFVVVTNQRSGSRLLMEMLDSHPDIEAHDEILLKSTNQHKGYGAKIDIIKKEILSKEGVVGFKLPYSQMTDRILNFLLKKNFKIIQLIRADKIGQCVWFPRFIEGDIEARYNEDLGTVRVKADEVKKYILQVLNWEESMEKYADFVLYYEFDLTQMGRHVDEFYNDKTRKDLLEFLGVEDMPLKGDLKKREPRAIARVIENIKEVYYV